MNRMIEAAADNVVSTIVSQNVRTGLDPDTLRRAVLDYLLFFQGRHPAIASRNDFYLATAYAVRDRLFQRGVKSLDLLFQHPEARTVAYLSAEFLIGPQLAANLVNLGIYESMQKALATIDVRLDDLVEHEREPGSRQWRPRPARGLLPRLARHPGSARHRLRHPLRIRHFRPGDPRRLAGRAHRQMAAPRLSLGSGPPRTGRRRVFRRPHGAICRRIRSPAGALASRRNRARHPPRHADSRLPRRHLQPAAAVVRTGGRDVSTSRLSMSATTRKRSSRRSAPRPSPRCCIPTTSIRRARYCASSSSISSWPARCRT